MINLIMNVSYTHLLVTFLDYYYIHLLTLGVLFFSDRIFDEHMTTYDLFQEIAKPIIDAAVQGFHGELVMYLWMYIRK